MKNRTNTTNTIADAAGGRARLTIAAIALGSMFFAACSADETASPVADSAPVASDVSAPETAAPVPTEPTATTPPATTTPTTTPPATSPPATDPPATDPPATNPPPTDPPATDPPSTDAPTPVFDDFTASNVSECAAPDVSVPTVQRMVTLTWAISGADSIYVAIDNVNGPFEVDLPATGSLQLPVSCPDDHTYYVVAENAAGRTVMEATR